MKKTIPVLCCWLLFSSLASAQSPAPAAMKDAGADNPASPNTISLFDGKTLTGWKSGRYAVNGSFGPFSVNEAEQAIHVYQNQEDGSAQEMDLLYTDASFSHYILKFEYKWGNKKFAPRHASDRDAGLLFHVSEAVGDTWKGWPASIEFQMGDSDHFKKEGKRWCTGDAWVIGLETSAEIPRAGRYYDAQTAPSTVGQNKKFDGVWTRLGREKPHGEWNQAMIRVEGDKKVYFFLNGTLVNEVANIRTEKNGQGIPVKQGRIGLQAEWSEVFYRNITIQEINE